VLSAVAWLIKFDVQFFAQSESGLAWLTDDSPRLPALLSEWAATCGEDAPTPDELAEPRAPYSQPNSTD
jgi:hypothetical protein